MQFVRVDNGFLVLSTASLPRKLALSVLAAILILPAVRFCWGAFRAGRTVQSEVTLESYSRALEQDPANARLWWNRGRLRHYSLSNADIRSAEADYKRALDLNPYLGQAWIDLSDCYDRSGRVKDAEISLEKAFSVHAYSPLIRWQAGNFYLRRSNLPGMYDCFKTACRYDNAKLGIALEVAWKIDPDHDGILQKLVPDNFRSNLWYLNFLVARDALDLASPAWNRVLKNAIPEDFEFKPSSAFGYIDRLLASNRIREALQVWDGALRKAGLGPADTRLKDAPAGNMMWNGSFENEILRGGFDWRYPDISEVRFQVDAGERMDKLKSLRVTFGNANIASGYLHQIVPIPRSGMYRLDFYFRTENLTTDRMPYLIIQGFPDASVFSTRSEYFPAGASWSKMSIPLMIGEDCKAVRISLGRDRSSKFDNQLKGTLWLDGFVLSRQADTKPAVTLR